MKLIKGSYLLGYVETQVEGDNPEHFLQMCMNNGVMLWDIKIEKQEFCTARMRLRDVSTLKKLRFGTPYKVRFSRRYGIPFINRKLRKRKPLLLGLFLSILFFILLSNMIWKVEVSGVPDEVENKIYEELTNYGVYPGAFGFSIASPNQIQQQLLENVPELLWVGVEKKGTSFHLEGVEKLIIEEEEAKSPRHLIASKHGVIKSVYAKRGLPQVQVNDVVEKGDILVSGSIEKLSVKDLEPDEESDKEEKAQEFEFVAAEGEVIATTWYEANVEIPLEVQQADLTGRSDKNYRVKLGSFSFPVWPWKKEEFIEEWVETEEWQLEPFGFQLPLYFITENRLETTTKVAERTKEEAVQIGIEQAKEDLERMLGYEANITSEKVLHETIDHGKVNVSLYITVEENIVIEQLINQGD